MKESTLGSNMQDNKDVKFTFRPSMLMALQEIYTLTDDSTSLPFLDEQGYCYLFSKKEYAEEALDYYTQQRRIWHLKTIPHKDIYPFLGCEFYSNGANGAVIDNGQNYSMHKPEEFVARPDRSDMPPAQRPVENPDFIRAMTMLQQERHWRVDYPEKKKVFTAYEDEMIRTFVKARFLVPFKTDANHSHLSFASLENGDGKTAMPIFSDWDQFILTYDLREWNGWTMTAEDLLAAPDDSMVLNVGTLAFVMTKHFIQQMFSIYKNELQPKNF